MIGGVRTPGLCPTSHASYKGTRALPTTTTPTTTSRREKAILVVGHNGINQALALTALGLPPSTFRSLQVGGL